MVYYPLNQDYKTSQIHSSGELALQQLIVIYCLISFCSSQEKGSIRVNPLSSKAWTLLASSKLFWLTYRILIPIYYLNVPIGLFWITFWVTELVTGWYLAFNFQVFFSLEK